MPENNNISSEETQLLRFTARYRLLFKEAAYALAGSGDMKGTEAALKALTKRNLLQMHSGQAALAQNVPFFTLTSLGASTIGAARERSTISGTSALSTHLGILWFTAFAEGVKRKRVENSEISDGLGGTLHYNNHHVAELQGSRTIVYRAYSTKATLSNIQKWAFDTLQGLPTSYKEAVSHGDYGLAVLCEASTTVEKLKQYLQRPYGKNQRLKNRVRVVVESAPSTATFPTEYARRFGN